MYWVTLSNCFGNAIVTQVENAVNIFSATDSNFNAAESNISFEESGTDKFK